MTPRPAYNRKFNPNARDGARPCIEPVPLRAPTQPELATAAQFAMADALRGKTEAELMETDRLIGFEEMGRLYLNGRTPKQVRGLFERYAVPFLPLGTTGGETTLANKQRLLAALMTDLALEQAGLHDHVRHPGSFAAEARVGGPAAQGMGASEAPARASTRTLRGKAGART